MNRENEDTCRISIGKIDITPFAYTISLVDGKWKMQILFYLWKVPVMRYSELKRSLGKVTHKMLSSQLKELVEDGIVVRKEYPQIPPKVEYYLSDTGKSLMPILTEMCKWGKSSRTSRLAHRLEAILNTWYLAQIGNARQVFKAKSTIAHNLALSVTCKERHLFFDVRDSQSILLEHVN